MFGIGFNSFQEMFAYLSFIFLIHIIHIFFISPYQDSSTRYQKFSELYVQVLEKERENHKDLNSKLYGCLIVYLLAFYHTCKIIFLSNTDKLKKVLIKTFLSPIKLTSSTYLQPCYIESTKYYIPIRISSNTNPIDILSINSEFDNIEIPCKYADEVLKNLITSSSEPISLINLIPSDFGSNKITVDYLTDEGINIKTFSKSDEIILV